MRRALGARSAAGAGASTGQLSTAAGGKSFGGRMTSQAQALAPLPDVLGLVFVGFPLHPAGRPPIVRAAHLSEISVPMLFLQGSRDLLADLPLMKASVADLGELATLRVIEGADHAFHVLARSGRTDAQAMGEMLAAFMAWAGRWW